LIDKKRYISKIKQTNMGFKDLFITKIEDKKAEPVSVATVTQSAAIPVPVAQLLTPPQEISGAVTTTPTVQSQSGEVNTQVLEQLCTLMDKTDTGKSNYLTFKKSVDALKEYQPDENARFLTAFITLKPTNTELTKEGLINSVSKYIKLIEEEHSHGQKELAEVRNEVIGKQEKIIELQSQELTSMEQKVIELKRSISEISSEILSKKNEFQKKEEDFNITIEMVLNQLNNDKSKIETILK
jgi:hypothetical protein